MLSIASNVTMSRLFAEYVLR